MKTWSAKAKHPSQSSRHGIIYNRILVLFLAIALAGGSFGGVAAAADDVAVSVYITSTSQEPGKLYVDDNSIILNAYVSMSLSGDKNVTEDATWTSTSSNVKVSKGVVTATGPVASATITARYKEKTDTFIVTAEQYFDEVKLKLNSADAADELDAYLGTNLNLSAVGIKGSTSEDVTSTATWTTSNSTIATVDKGVVKPLTEGEVKITVKSKGKTDSVELKVKSPYEEIQIRNAAGNVYSGPLELTVGTDDTLKLTAYAKAKSGSYEAVSDDAIWTSSNTAVVKVEEKGKLTVVGKGTAIVTAKRLGGAGTLTVIVKTPYEALKITPEKPIYTTLYGAKVELTATANSGSTGAKDATDLVEWKVSDEDQAVAVIEKAANGKTYVVPKGAGTAEVKVTYLGLSKSLTVNVSPTIESITVAKDTLDVFAEETVTLPTVTGTLLTGETKDVGSYVQWTSDNENVVVLEESGKWKAVGSGTTTLTAQVGGVMGTTLTKTVTVNVHNKILTLIPAQDTISVVIGREVDLPTVRLIYENGEEEVITDKVTWKSSTANLLVKSTSMKGLLAANATLTGTYLNKTVKVKVTVEEEFTSFAITPAKVSVTLNRTQTVKVVGTTKSGKKVTLSSRVDWKASNEEHVTIKGSTVRGLTEGSGTLTASVQGKPLEIPYVVTAKLTKLTASETSFKAVAGNQFSVSVTALYENGKTANVTSQATWTTSKPSVATVTNGQISVKAKGSATIKGTFGGKSVTIRVSAK